MVRKGWRTVEVPNGWLQIIRGPKPPSAKWPQSKPSDKPHRRRVPSFQANSHTTSAWSTVPKTDTGVESFRRSGQDCPHTGLYRSSGRRGSRGGGVVEEGFDEGGVASKNSTSRDPDCSCRSVHREGQETSGRGGREDPQGCRGVAPGRGGEGCRHPSNCGGRGTSGASESPTRFNQSHPPQS